MKKNAKVAAYVGNGDLPDEKSLHLAICRENEWKKLNFGVGVLFAEAEFDDESVAGRTKLIEEACLYRGSDRRFVVAAVTASADGKRDAGFALWTSMDLVHYSVSGRQNEAVFSEERKKTEIEKIDLEGTETEASVLELTEGEADYLEKKLGEIYNVGVAPVEVHVPVGKPLSMLPQLKAYYSDGSQGMIPVRWDRGEFEAISCDKPGVYTVSGKVVTEDYPVPIVSKIADPMIQYYHGWYYLVATDETPGNKNLYIRRSDWIGGMENAEPKLIFKGTETGEFSGCNWAPELHVIGGRLCCLFASSTTGKWDGVQSRIMCCNGDPENCEDWGEPIRIRKRDGSHLIEKGITLDMTYFEAAGRSYYCWANRVIDERGVGTSDLYLAEIDPLNPERLMGDPVCILRPKYAWNRQHTEVVEGPNVLKRDGRLFLTFSGDSVSDYYCMGLLTASEDSDLLDPSSWQETGYPVLGREHVAGERGPGHNSFARDRSARDVLIYHMKPDGGERSFCARTIHYGFDGTPCFYMTEDKLICPEYRNVTAKVVVEEPAYLFVHFREKGTPDGEQVYFGLSTDGFHWEKVNGGQPVLWSFVGEKGVRDFTVARCELTGKYYIFATDLSLAYNMKQKYHNAWREVSRNGSKNLVMWESDDLVNWSESRLVKLGDENYGCLWAPDIYYDRKRAQYVLHWSSAHADNGYGDKAIYYSCTKDFQTFTKPEVLYRKEDSGIIDSALYEEGGRYYLFVKSEKNPLGVILLVADDLKGPYEQIASFDESKGLQDPWAYEAPTAFRTAAGKWCLFLDYFGVPGEGQGYVPFTAEQMAGGKFERSDNDFSFPYGYKHGTVLTITRSEYQRIKEHVW